MPLGLLRLAAPGGRVPLLGDQARLGGAPELEVVLGDPRVRALHARLRPLRGEWAVAAEDGAPLWVNGRPVPFFQLRHGDRIDLVDPGAGGSAAFVLEDRLAGMFVPPGTSRLAAWLSLPAAHAAEAGPARYGIDLAGLGPEAACLPGREPGGGAECLVEVAAPEPDASACERALQAASSVAGAPHAGLAHVLDVGVVPAPAGPRPWIAVRRPSGRAAEALARGAPLALGTWLRVLADVARGLAWMHRRGCLQRAVGLATLWITADGRGVLVGQQHARAWRQGVPRLAPGADPGRLGAPELVAPEERVEPAASIGPAVDVYGLCAAGFALLAGSWSPLRAQQVAAELRGERRRPPSLASLGAEVPADLEQLLQEGLAAVPAQRPNASDVARRLEGLASLWGMELA